MRYILLLLTLSSCQPEIVPQNERIEANGYNITQYCPRCGYDTTLTFYTNPFKFLNNEQARHRESVKRNPKRNRSKRD